APDPALAREDPRRDRRRRRGRLAAAVPRRVATSPVAGQRSEAKPRSSRRVASPYMFDESRTTATSDTPPRVADATRHGPALCVYPVFTPFAPRYVPRSLLLFT